MARGRTTSLTVRLTPMERQTLLAWQRATTIGAGRARRGRIILLVADGIPIAHVAATVGISRRFVYKWVQRFQDKGLEGLIDKPGRGYRRVSRQPVLTERHASDVGERQHIAC
jgi:biotin operon repressor